MKYMVTLVGSLYAGKSSIIGSFMRGSPYQSQSVDLEDGCYKEIHLKNDQSINLMIMDTHGQERYRAINKFFIKRSKATLIVFNTNNKSQYKEAVEYWYPEAIECNKDTLIILVGVIYSRNYYFNEVLDESIPLNFAKEHNILYRTVSYEQYVGIEELFQEVAEILYKREFGGEDNSVFYIKDCTKNNKHVNKKQCV